MLRTALYYPHTSVRTADPSGERLLKRALLLWDTLEFIVPFSDYHPHYTDPVVAEAMELIGRFHCPDNQEKCTAHAEIEALVAGRSLPDVFYYRGEPDPYEIYPEKFMPETWRLLQESHLGRFGHHVALTPHAGLCIMAILADCCAGSTRSRVTDRTQAYASLAGLLSESDDTEVGAPIAEDATRERLVSTTLALIDVNHFSLNELVALRKKEASQGGHNLTDLRHRYLERVENYVKQLTENSKLTPSDFTVLEREFEQDMKLDLMTLRDELRAEFKEAIFSRDVLVTMLAGAGTLAGVLFASPLALPGVITLAGAPVTIGGILGARNSFFKARAKILREHPMAYLYESRGGFQL